MNATCRRWILPALLLLLPIAAPPPAFAETTDPASGSTAERAPEVVGGTPVPTGKWRDAAAVIFTDYQGCTGVLVAPNVVLTAGHCIGGVTAVKLGVNNLTLPGEVINVIEQIEYPMSYRTYDIGLLKLASDSTIEPRVIATDCIRDTYIADGADVAIVGYGATDNYGQEYPDELMEAFTTITDHDCSEDLHGCRAEVRPDGELTAGGDGIDSCNGDSGGPLYLLTERGDYLVGITSRAFSDSTLPCSQGGIYVRPDKIIEWIETQSGVTLPRAGCNAEPVPSAEPTPIEVEAGSSVETLITPNDPDLSDSHVFSVAVAAEHGEVITDADGIATYTADSDYEGEDSFTIAVTDDGAPTMTGTVVILVTVTPNAGCGCQTGAGGGSGLLVLGVAGLLWRRRRG